MISKKECIEIIKKYEEVILACQKSIGDRDIPALLPDGSAASFTDDDGNVCPLYLYEILDTFMAKKEKM